MDVEGEVRVLPLWQAAGPITGRAPPAHRGVGRSQQATAVEGAASGRRPVQGRHPRHAQHAPQRHQARRT
eukprot:1952246-Pyramimonas_sp.AAC.1